jgi:hypothetical protein
MNRCTVCGSYAINPAAPKLNAMQTNSDAQTRAMRKQRDQESAGQQRIDTPESALARAMKRDAA